MINTAKQLMLEGKPAIGAEAGLGSIIAVETLASIGWDYIMVDNQHGNWSDHMNLDAFRSIKLGGSIPISRVRHNEYSAIGRLLDQGALGIIVPMVNTEEDAKIAVNAVRYPPLGTRSNGAYGVKYFGDDYLKQANEEIFLAVQIETKSGLENVDKIMGVEGIDGCWVGPSDLALSLGVEFESKEHDEAILKIFDACDKSGKIPGICCFNTGMTKKWLSKGALFVTSGADISFMMEGSNTTLKELGR